MVEPKKRLAASALRYDPENGEFPEVVASGQGNIAEKIIQLAEEAGLPVRQDPMLAEALSGLQLGDQIPPELYMAVAEALVWAWQSDQKLRKLG